VIGDSVLLGAVDIGKPSLAPMNITVTRGL